MPLIDLPIDELLEYKGRNPRPEGFDDYWSAALAELDDTPADPELVPSEFRVPGSACFDLWFTGVGGMRIHAKYLRPESGTAPLPALMCFHGYSASSGDWASHLPYVSTGCCVAAMDCRGQGGRSQDFGGGSTTTMHGHIVRGLGDAPESLYYRATFLDTVQLARVVAGFAEVDSRRLGSVGGSQGGALALVCAALDPRVSRTAATYPFLCDYQRVWEMDLGERAYNELREFFRRHDPTHARSDHYFNHLGYIDVQHLAPRIRGRVLMATGLMDKTCPPSTQFAAYNKLVCEKDVVFYPDYGHENLPGWDDRVLSFFATWTAADATT